MTTGERFFLYFFIINEQAGNGAGGRVWGQIEPVLQARGVPYRYAITSSAAQAQQSVRNAIDEHPPTLVAVLGGDGTIHSIVPLLSASGIPLAVIPAGSGNDTARGFGIPRKPLAALDVALSGRMRSIDLIGTAGGERTLTALAVGFDAEVANAVNASGYKAWCNRLGIGRLAYIIGVLQTLFRYQPARLELILDDGTAQTFDQAWLVAVTNTTSYGGGLRICPEARTDDGVLDVCVVHRCTKWQLLRLFPTILFGRHTKLPFVTMLRASKIEIQSELQRIGFGDGEQVAVTPLTAEIQPGALQLITAHS
ncbi:diacylglycerol/lipid kinase family protein [Paenibacillus sp. GCM10027629]|uniref:diacylglycerol/lipid kinase family protein n=1 Tax=Paenibacillus sp. GCM10027629 TaxID=3273414 RepID=UPI00363C5CDB